MGIAYALVSMLFAGVNDFVFKQYTNGARQSLGLFLGGVGLVWTVFFGILLLTTAGSVTWTHWPISVGAGLVSILSNILLVRSFRTFPAGTGATIYRLNLVVVAVLSFFWLQEPATLWKMIGITLGAAAVLSLGRIPAGNSSATRVTSFGIAILITACVLRALMGILYKLASTHGIPMYELLAINGAVWGVGGLLYAVTSRESLHLNTRMTGFVGMSGLLVCGITYFMLAATRIAEASIAIPITQMSFVVTCALGATLHNEPFTSPKLFAIAAAVGCVVCLTQG
ncbi:MAG: EamA-like transporter family protein [bacterium ADurb.Bin429]|nr:MAG: EamA-like transporter family protein [bacterium ADurb.Bin429]